MNQPPSNAIAFVVLGMKSLGFFFLVIREVSRVKIDSGIKMFFLVLYNNHNSYSLVRVEI
jgi:hypothetical protein